MLSATLVMLKLIFFLCGGGGGGNLLVSTCLIDNVSIMDTER